MRLNGQEPGAARNTENTCNFASDLITYGRKETCEYYQGVYMENLGLYRFMYFAEGF